MKRQSCATLATLAFLFLIGASASTVAGKPQASTRTWFNVFSPGASAFGLRTDERDPRVVYAATARGIYRLGPGSSYWSPFFIQYGQYFTLGQSRSTPAVMYVASGSDSGNGALWKTEDAGESWALTGSGVVVGSVSQVVVDPTNASNVYVSAAHEIFATRNGGRSWARITPPGAAGTDLYLAHDPSTSKHLLLATYRPPYAAAVKESTDGGETWSDLILSARVAPFGDSSRITRADTYKALSFDTAAATVLSGLAGVAGSADHVILSTDAGRTWQDMSLPPTRGAQPVEATTHAVLDAANLTFLLGTTGGLFHTSVERPRWNRLFSAPVTALVAPAPDTILAATPLGVRITTDSGRCWRTTSLGLPVGKPGPFTTDASRYLGPFTDGKSPSFVLLSAIGADGSTVFVATGGGYWVSRDAGLTWRWVSIGQTAGPETLLEAPPPSGGDSIRQIVPASDGSLFLSLVSQGIFESGGSSVVRLDTSGKLTPLRIEKSPRQIAGSRSEPQVLYVTSRASGHGGGNFGIGLGTELLKTEDGGFSWSRLDLTAALANELRGRGIEALPSVVVSPTTADVVWVLAHVAGRTFGEPPSLGLLTSSDGGRMWSDRSVAMNRKLPVSGGELRPPSLRLVLHPREAQVGFLVAAGALLRSQDMGGTWGVIDTTSASGRILDFAVAETNPATFYLSTENGVWRRSESGSAWEPIGDGLRGDPIDVLKVAGDVVWGQGRYGIFKLVDPSTAWSVPASEVCIPVEGKAIDGPGPRGADEDGASKPSLVAAGGSPMRSCFGSWFGNVKQRGVKVPYAVKLSIDSANGELSAGAEVGDIAYPSLGCAGRVSVSSLAPTAVVVTEEIVEGRAKCVSGGRIRLAVTGEAQLSAEWLDRAERVIASALLERAN